MAAYADFMQVLHLCYNEGCIMFSRLQRYIKLSYHEVSLIILIHYVSKIFCILLINSSFLIITFCYLQCFLCVLCCVLALLERFQWLCNMGRVYK